MNHASRNSSDDDTSEQRRRKRQRAERFGRWAETVAIALLILKGYRILARRMRTPVGEIDLVAKRGKLIAFIEVKARPQRQDTLAAITQKQQNRIMRAAEWYRAGRTDLGDCDVRFDLIGVAPRSLPIHLPDAFRL